MSGFKSIDELHKSMPKPKDMMIDANKLITDPEIQIRVRPGESGLGFVSQFTTTKVNDLKVNILAVGRVLEPLHVWERGKGDLVTLRGNTRLAAVKELLAEDTTPQSVAKAIEKLQCYVYTGISKEQAIAWVDDQSSVNRYTKVDIVNLIKRELMYVGDWREVVLSHARLIKEVLFKDSGVAVRNVEKLNAAKSRSEQLGIIETWLTGSVRQGIVDVSKLGDRVWKAFCLVLASEDGLLTETMEKAEFNPKTRIVSTEKGSKQTRIAYLKAIKGEMELARSKDQTLPAWDSNTGAFHDAIEKFILEDKGEIKTAGNIQRATAKMLKEFQTQYKSTMAKLAFSVALGEKPPQAVDADTQTYRCETIMGKLTELLPKMTNESAASIVAIIVHSSNAAELEKAFSKYVS